MIDRQQEAQLWVLAQAWRLAWSDFDGRTLKAQIEEIIGYAPKGVGLNGADVPDGVDAVAIREWMGMNGICVACGCWHDVCGCPDGTIPEVESR